MLRARWLGTVPFSEAIEIQRALFSLSADDHLLLLEHPPVYTLGARAKNEHLLADPSEIGADIMRVDRGGDVTFHGPGQLVGYPVLSYCFRKGAVAAYVNSVEQVVIDALSELGIERAARRAGYPGVWLEAGADPGSEFDDMPPPDSGGTPTRLRKVCAVGVRMSRGRTMHGFALNVSTDLSWFASIIPCGITDAPVTSLQSEGYDVTVTEVADVIVRHAGRIWGRGTVDYQRAGGREERITGRDLRVRAGFRESPGADSFAEATEDRHVATGTIPFIERKPAWLRAKARMDGGYLLLKSTMRGLDLVTVCEEAGCPNIFECWSEGTATFMINGDRCTRACGFCLVDTRRPAPPDPGEPGRVAVAVERMGLAHAVVTAVARDDLEDGGASGFVATVTAIRHQNPNCSVEVLIPDCKGRSEALDTIFDVQPDVLNHNLETVLRLQKAVRPSASYSRSLTVLARAKAAGLTTKSGLMVGLGEEREELLGAICDLRAVGVDILTVGQYLRPSSSHLPVARFWAPEELDELARAARAMGFSHVECSPLTRSSYHARRAVPTTRVS